MPSSSDVRPALVVSGSTEIRILLRGLLRLHRVRDVREARGEREAVDHLAAAPPGLILLDSTLEDGELPALFTALRQQAPGARIVLVSRDPIPEGLRPDAFLQRPFKLAQFADAIGPDGSPPAGPS
jgi:DNA-binding NtrC family response regulator